MIGLYLKLPNNSSMDFQLENTVATLKIVLPRRLELNSKYEVALMEIEIHYPCTTYAVDCFIMAKEDY
jgi:hypothetical protein